MMDSLFIGLGIFAVVCEIAVIIYLYRIWKGGRMNFQRGLVWDGGEGIVTATGKRILAAARDKDREDS